MFCSLLLPLSGKNLDLFFTRELWLNFFYQSEFSFKLFKILQYYHLGWGKILDLVLVNQFDLCSISILIDLFMWFFFYLYIVYCSGCCLSLSAFVGMYSSWANFLCVMVFIGINSIFV